MADTISEIIERLERASGPGDLKDLERPFLKACLGSAPSVSTGDDGGDEWHCGTWSSNPHPFYSIDAALTLVPEGSTSFLLAYWEKKTPPYGAHIGPSLDARGEAATPAIALCIAALRSRSHKET